ncbi:hypothetical protein [Anabaena sp. CS-542/02]|uniref:hypothetical protein n=1 Tax=Anabaena sp. CS-542/02 TaxID=3021719 RepID=UPI00232BA316|nr:hypothetical protein [Anabaena sp. CS-542/02]MDB9447086.1 hypothetical protein [Anabaena sp. CS-542/02]
MLHLPPHSKNFLIPPLERRKFFLQFTLITICGWFVATIASIALERLILGNFAPADSFPWVQILSTIIFAVIFAADQALVLGGYISGRLWTVATSAGWLIAHTATMNWVKYIFPQFAITGLLSTILYICSGIWLGLCQWLVLRRYAKPAWLWIFLPSVCFLAISLFTGVLSLVRNLMPQIHHTPILYWSEQSFKAIILGVIPALGLCSLKRNSHRPTKISSSSYLSNS